MCQLLGDIPLFNQDSFWLQAPIFEQEVYYRSLLKLYGLAWLSGFKPVVHIAEQPVFVTYLSKSPERVKSLLMPLVAEYEINEHQKALQLIIQLSLALKNLKPFEARLHQQKIIRPATIATIQQFLKPILAQLKDLLEQPEPKPELLGLQLLHALQTAVLIDGATVLNFLTLKRYKNENSISQVLDNIGQLHLKQQQDFARCCVLLCSYEQHRLNKICAKVIESRILLTKHHPLYAKDIRTVYAQLCQSVTQYKQTHLIDYIPDLIEMTLVSNTELAFELWITTFTKQYHIISQRKKKSAYNIFKRCTFKLLEKCHLKQEKAFIALLKHQEEQIDRMIQRFVFQTEKSYHRFWPHVKQLIQAEALDPSTQQRLLSQQKTFTKNMSTERWTDVLELTYPNP